MKKLISGLLFIVLPACGWLNQPCAEPCPPGTACVAGVCISPGPTPTPTPPTPTPPPTAVCPDPPRWGEALGFTVQQAEREDLEAIINGAFTGLGYRHEQVLPLVNGCNWNSRVFYQGLQDEIRRRGYCAYSNDDGTKADAIHIVTKDGKTALTHHMLNFGGCRIRLASQENYHGDWSINSDPALIPSPTPTPTPTPGPLPPPCGEPIPGPVAVFKVGIHNRGPNWTTLDSTPLVGRVEGTGLTRDHEYCRKIGFTDGRGYCPARPEGHPERFACEALALGGSVEWFWNDRSLDLFEVDSIVRPDNRFMLLVRPELRGTAKVCAPKREIAPGHIVHVCGEITL